jgi:hypothetical protein
MGMKHIIVLLCSIILVCAVNSFAGVIPISPPGEGDLGDLDHSKAYLWEINLKNYIPNGEVLTGAQVSINDIQNWMEPENDILYVSLLDMKTPSKPGDPNQVVTFTDNQAVGNFFGTTNPNWIATSTIGSYSDNNDRYGWTGSSWWKRQIHTEITEDISWNLDINKMISYSGDNGWIGLGFDPDCHYWNTGVKLTLTTKPASVPEPGLFSLMLLGFTGIFGAFLKQRKSKIK